jgi:hypothetical protein
MNAVQSEKVAKAFTGQSRDRSSSANARTPQSQPQLLRGTSHFRSKLNRQTPELEIALSLRKQRSANGSNRPKIEFCKSRNPSASLAKSRPIPNCGPRANWRPSICTDGVCRSLGECQLPLATSHSPLVTRISNRELLELEIPQPAENKHRRAVLIENFEPNDCRSFGAFVAAAFRRAFGFHPLIRAGESALARGCQ